MRGAASTNCTIRICTWPSSLGCSCTVTWWAPPDSCVSDTTAGPTWSAGDDRVSEAADGSSAATSRAGDDGNGDGGGCTLVSSGISAGRCGCGVAPAGSGSVVTAVCVSGGGVGDGDAISGALSSSGARVCGLAPAVSIAVRFGGATLPAGVATASAGGGGATVTTTSSGSDAAAAGGAVALSSLAGLPLRGAGAAFGFPGPAGLGVASGSGITSGARATGVGGVPASSVGVATVGAAGVADAGACVTSGTAINVPFTGSGSIGPSATCGLAGSVVPNLAGIAGA